MVLAMKDCTWCCCGLLHGSSSGRMPATEAAAELGSSIAMFAKLASACTTSRSADVTKFLKHQIVCSGCIAMEQQCGILMCHINASGVAVEVICPLCLCPAANPCLMVSVCMLCSHLKLLVPCWLRECMDPWCFTSLVRVPAAAMRRGGRVGSCEVGPQPSAVCALLI